MLKINEYVCDETIFQYGKPHYINGSSFSSALIKFSLKNTTTLVTFSDTTLADLNGDFSITLPPMPHSYDFYQLEISDEGQVLVYNSILFGHVLIAAGQSNMAYSIKYMTNKEEILSALESEHYIRSFNIQDFLDYDGEYAVLPDKPQRSFRGRTFISTSNPMFINVSGIATMTALNLRKKLNMPIGIINTAVGGCSIDSYLPKAAIEQDTVLKDFMIKHGFYCYTYHDMQNKERSFTMTSGIYNDKIAPLQGISVGSMIWYQGESWANNFTFAKMYQRALKHLIMTFRQMFGMIPIALCHIAPHYYPYNLFATNHLNEAISLQALKETCCTALPTYDVHYDWSNDDGDKIYHPIHPTTKQTWAKRCSHALLQLLQNNQYKSPHISNFTTERLDDNTTALCLSIEGGDLTVGESFNGFSVKAHERFMPVAARAVSKTQIQIIVPSASAKIQVMYAFAPFAQHCNCTASGIPLLPYRSRKEEASEKTYLLPSLYEDLKNEYVCHNVFDPSFGFNGNAPIWQRGTFHKNQNVTVTHSTSGIHVLAQPNHLSCYHFGISPVLPAFGYSYNLDRIQSFKIKIELIHGNQVQFKSLLAKTPKHLRRLSFLDKTSEKTLQLGSNEFILTTQTLYDCDLAIRDGNLANAQSVQLTFQTTESCELTVKELSATYKDV